MTRTVLLACFTTGCAARDPAVRPLYEIPLAGQGVRPFATEEAAVHAVSAVLQGVGLPTDRADVQIRFNAGIDSPVLQGSTIIVPRWITPDEDVKARLGALVESTLQAPVDLGAWTDEDAQAAWSALQLAQLTDQLIRSAEVEIGVPESLDDPSAVDRRAVDAHMPVLAVLVEQHQIPSTWPDAYTRLLSELVPRLPPEQAPVLQHALDRAQRPLTMEQVVEAYDTPDGTRRRVEEAVRVLSQDPTLGEPTCTADEGTLDCGFGAARRRLLVRYWEDQDLGSVRWVLPFRASAPAAPGLLQFVNEANAYSVGACTLYLEDDALVAAGPPFQVKGSAEVLGQASGLEARCAPFFEPFLAVAEQGQPADRTWEALRQSLEAL